jgi:pimeloyl-ACP methyl ester carboxylesterase
MGVVEPARSSVFAPADSKGQFMNQGMQQMRASRRDFLFGTAAVCAAVGGLLPYAVRASASQSRAGLPVPIPAPKEHWVPRDGFKLYVQEYPGSGPALVMLHGFPDNLHIFDRIIPYLVAAGRHVVAFDFLGFGKSDKPDGYPYGFDQQRQDIEAVVNSLSLGKTIPVAHDAGGVAGLNYILSDPQRIAGLCLLNTFYGDTRTLRFPELIELFSDPDLAALSREMMSDPKQMAFLLNFQNKHFQVSATPEQKTLFDDVLQPIINENFAQKPSAGPAFVKMTGGLREQLKVNDGRLDALARLALPTSIIWGKQDPHLNEGVAQDFSARLRGSRLHLVDAGHWLQIDAPQDVSKFLLADLD